MKTKYPPGITYNKQSKIYSIDTPHGRAAIQRNGYDYSVAIGDPINGLYRFGLSSLLDCADWIDSLPDPEEV